MSNHRPGERFPDPFARTDAERRALAEDTLWSTLGILYRWRRFLLAVTGGMAVLAVVLSLLMDNWYQAEARLLLPARTGTGLLSSAVLNNLPTAARSLIGSGGGDYFRYLSILSSHTTYGQVVDAFNLIDVYETEDSPTPRPDAIKLLAENVEFLIDDEYEFLTVAVSDIDRQRAADLANFFVEELNRRNAELASQSARNFRQYIEQRYNESEAGLDSVLTALRVLQETYGVLDLGTQGEQFFEYVAQLRLEALQLEGEYEVLLGQFGPENSQVQSAQQAARSANRKYRQALDGEERLLPIAKEKLPGVAQEFLALERERLILTTLLEFVRPALEEARFDEERQVEAVQVVDVATPPARKAGPRRSIIVVAATLSAFLLAVLFVLVYTWWRRNHAYFAQRLRQAADEPEGAPAPEAPTPQSLASS